MMVEPLRLRLHVPIACRVACVALALVSGLGCSSSAPAASGGAVVTLHILPGNLSLPIHETVQLSVENRASVAPRGVRWSSPSPQVATVDSMGVVTALRVGFVQISAVSITDSRRSGAVLVTVTDQSGPMASISPVGR